MKRLIGAVVGSLLVHAVLMANTSALFKEPPRFAVKPGTSSVRMTFASPSETQKETNSTQQETARDAEPENPKPETGQPEEPSHESTEVPDESTHQQAVEEPTSPANDVPETKTDPIGPLPSPEPVGQRPEQEPAPRSDPVEPEEPPVSHQQPGKASERVAQQTETESDPPESSSSPESSDDPSDTTSAHEPTSPSNQEAAEETTETSEELLREAARSRARQAGAKWVSDAEYRRNPPPTYPTKARVLGQEGTVKLLVEINGKGRPTRVEIKQSSGSFLLDQAAQKAVRNWSFVAANEAGRSVPSLTIVPIDFELER